MNYCDKPGNTYGKNKMFEYPPGATPLDQDEINQLIPQHISTQQQLNEWEEQNILEITSWTSRQQFNLSQIITTSFIRNLHLKMFNKTWQWAGKFRHSNKNIGVDWHKIPIALKILLDDVNYQINNQSFPIDELATRFHHRLVAIHPFPNGNGRHSRLMTDIILLSQNQPRFSWGNINLTSPSDTRKSYIKALQTADKKNLELLLKFVRS